MKKAVSYEFLWGFERTEWRAIVQVWTGCTLEHLFMSAGLAAHVLQTKAGTVCQYCVVTYLTSVKVQTFCSPNYICRWVLCPTENFANLANMHGLNSFGPVFQTFQFDQNYRPETSPRPGSGPNSWTLLWLKEVVAVWFKSNQPSVHCQWENIF